MKKALLTGVAIGVLSGGLVMATSALAQTTTPAQNPEASLIQELASKFNLNTNDVQSVFDQHRQEMQSKMESNYENYLENLVKAGTLTEEQEQLILTKHKQLATQMQSNKDKMKNMTPAERKAQMGAARQDIETWAKQNNIDPKYLRPFGPRMRGGSFNKPSPTPTP